MPLQALNRAVVCAKETMGLIHHSDHGSQFVTIGYNEGLNEHGITASTGTFGDSYDNELIQTRSWIDVVDVEIATFEWVTWWNESQVHESLDYRTPAEVEPKFWEHNPDHVTMKNKAHA